MMDILIREDFPRKVKEIENTWIEMPDGIRLAARIWLPSDAEDDPVPAILEYLPYRKRDGTVERDHLTHPYFAGHGYAGIRVDMRGTGDSEGVCLGEYLKQEQDDALSVIEWLAGQTWCSGKVGMIGISWGGFNGLQVAARKPAALAAVISLCSTDDRYADDIHFMGGAVLVDKLNWGATAFSISNTPPDPEIVGDRWREVWKQRLENNGLWMMDWFRHQRRCEFYAHGSVCENYADIETPVYMVGGWADGYTNAIFRTLENLSCPKKGLIGPWAHKYPHFAKPGPGIGFLQECLRWWDQHLKGVDTGIMAEPQLRAWIQDPVPPAPYYELRPGKWVAENGWQGKAKKVTSYYTDGEHLHKTPQSSSLVINSPQNAGVASASWCIYSVIPDGALDQNLEQGLMTHFETAPFEADVEWLGFPVLHAEVVSSTPQANLVAVLSVVDEDGKAGIFSYGVLNLTHRNSHSEPEPMPEGKAEPISIQLNACGQRIKKGQRVRLALSTSYWPVIWPSQSAATLTLTGTRLDLPLREADPADSTLTPFAEPEAAQPMATETLSDGGFSRKRTIDHLTGIERFERCTDTGEKTHLHTGVSVRSVQHECFDIHPADPNSACGQQKILVSYRRGDWQTQLETEVRVEAKADCWQVTANLRAQDGEGVVIEKSWDEKISRDLV
ncbi:MAG: CocE/NonD family hydrolase [Parvularculales bacterium]